MTDTPTPALDVARLQRLAEQAQRRLQADCVDIRRPCECHDCRDWRAVLEALAEIARLTAERDEARQTNTRLNRRCTVAESAVKDNLEACQKAGQSFGRRLSHAGYLLIRAELETLRADREAAEGEVARLRSALANLAIDGVTAGANPQRDGTMRPPLWHMNCRLCNLQWSKIQWKRPEEHPAVLSSPFNQACVLAPQEPTP